ncbi:MAG: hypothetical protein JWO46_1920 [Nocardioidaceae bacterium]|nr:hypothetical protein [Nocardioidaceae bacterium]
MTTTARPLGPSPDLQRELDAATSRLLTTVDAMTAEEWSAPSVLPDWTRAHVLAHLALNAEALAGVVAALGRGEPAAMYTTNEVRDADIDALVQDATDAVQARLRAGCAAIGNGVRHAPEAVWLGDFQRVPGDPDISAPLLHTMRHREVEIHHADLQLGYRHTDWPEAFSQALVETVVVDRADRGPFTVVADDLGGRWTVGEGDGPTVHGAAADLGWWLVGRGSGEGLTCDAALPDLGAWRGAKRP